MGLVHLAGLGDKEKLVSPNRGYTLGPVLNKSNGNSLPLGGGAALGEQRSRAGGGKVPMANSSSSGLGTKCQGGEPGLREREVGGRRQLRILGR